MSRYIAVDELNLAKFHPLPYTHITPADIKDVEAYERGWNDAIDAIIENAPNADVVEKKRYVRCRENVNILADALSKYQSADVVEVVRCKDCKYYNLQHHYCEGIGNWFGLEGEWSDNGFCYKGERRTDDDRNG